MQAKTKLVICETAGCLSEVAIIYYYLRLPSSKVTVYTLYYFIVEQSKQIS